MDTKNYQNLLSQVNTLTAHYKKIDDLTGENFNVFRILKLETSEVRMHSAFLAALLDPNGSHGQKDNFLKLFINRLCFKQSVFDTINCKVEIEKHAGFISDDLTEGGRIDIIITDAKGNHIIIENKIYAGDQHNQLTRYHKYSPNADLIYLTLDRKLPDEKSFGELIQDTHFRCYSYKSDIINWLEDCRKEVAVYPIIRESLTQYINLLKYLTNQTLNHTMQQELNQILLSNLEASFTISSGLDHALNELLDNDFFPKLQTACKSMGLLCENGVNFNRNYSGIWIKKDDWQYFNLGFQFQNTDKNLIYGFCHKQDPLKYPIPIKFRNDLNLLANKSLKQNEWWPLYYKMEEPYSNWQQYQAWKAIADGTMLNVMIEKIAYLLKITETLTL